MAAKARVGGEQMSEWGRHSRPEETHRNQAKNYRRGGLPNGRASFAGLHSQGAGSPGVRPESPSKSGLPKEPLVVSHACRRIDSDDSNGTKEAASRRKSWSRAQRAAARKQVQVDGVGLTGGPSGLVKSKQKSKSIQTWFTPNTRFQTQKSAGKIHGERF
jgi:hypothetical protein